MFTFEYSAQFGSEIPKTRPWWDIEARFLVSVESGDVDCTRHLLSLDHGGQKIDPDIRIYNGPAGSRLGKPAICSAIERGHFEMTKLLIDFGASVNLGDIFSPIHYAVKSLNLDILRLLISNRADVNALSSFGDSALHLAAQQPFSEIVQELIDGGAELDKEDSRGRSPLSLACIHNQSRVVEILLGAGANVNHEDKDGDSPLLHTIKSGLCLNSTIVGTLLKAGADPNHMNSFGQTPLTFTVRRCSETNLEGQVAVKQLIDHNCHVNVQEAGPFGENAIHLAISRGQDRITEMLIRAGCDLSCVNQFGATPLERVCREGKIELIKLMLASGSPVNLSQSYWDYFECYQSDDETLKDILRSHVNTTPSLKHFCRVRLRDLWGRRSDEIVEKINLPGCIKEYLRLNSL